MKNKYKYYLYCLLVSFIILMFTSKNSFLYPFNDWVDANAFFTMGKSMFQGVVPYKDLFEQKGLILYFIYGIGSLISFKSFIGVFILEVISFSIFLYFAHKIFCLFLDEKKSIILLPLLSSLICTSFAFTHGGGCEEFCFPYLCIGLYLFIKHFKKSKLTNKEIIIIGTMSGIVLMMKYTLLGLFIGIGLFLFIDYLRQKKYKESIKFCLLFLLGMIIPIVPCLIYLGINHAIKDFIDCYFIINITSYGSVKVSIFVKLFKLVKGFMSTCFKNGIIVFILLILFPLFISLFKTKKYFKISMIGIFLINIFFIFYGLLFYRYYLGPILIYMILSLASIMYLINKKFSEKKYKKMYNFLYISIPILCVFSSYYFSNYKEMIGSSKDNFFQFEYAEYINKYDKPTLLNMGHLDAGLYTVSGIVPNTRFFEVQNISYDRFPDNLDSMKENVINKDIKFILYYTRKDLNYVRKHDNYIFDNYELVKERKTIFEGVKFNAYLFKLKEINN